MAKTRAQRKAERRAREAREQRERDRQAGEESGAQRATQVPESGEVAEAEAVIETGASLEELEAPAPSRADVGAPEQPPRPAVDGRGRREEKRRIREEKRRAREERKAEEERRKEREERRRAKAAPPRKPAPVKEERQRGAVLSFLLSSWAELKRVQWPDRETLVQASAVTLVFVAIAAVYLGALDAAFNWIVKQVL